MKKLKIFGIITLSAAGLLSGCADGSQNMSNSTTVTRNSLPAATVNSSNSTMNGYSANANSTMTNGTTNQGAGNR